MTYRLFFDPVLLSTLVGEPVTARRLRWKPGLSTQAALLKADGSIVGWAQAVTPAHVDKAAKAVQRAKRFGHTVTVKEVPGTNHTLVFGPPHTDVRLIKAFRHLAEQDCGFSDIQLKRYNPARRAVFHASLDGKRLAVRLHSKPADAEGAQQRAAWLLERNITTVAPTARLKYVSLWPWVGSSDLANISGHDREQAARQAGAQLAEVHRLQGPKQLRSTSLKDAVIAQAHDIGRLDDELGARALELAKCCQWPDVSPVVAHGDFSADQVAVGEQQTWLLDFDRLQMLPAAMDIASFHAVELLNGVEPVTAALLEGYGEGLSMDEIRPYVAIALGQRVFEPFRAADPQWRTTMHTRLDQMEEWL